MNASDGALAAPAAPLRLALPKGRMAAAVHALLDEAGIRVRAGARDYRPLLSAPGFEAKLLKPQSVVEMLSAGSRDVGFAGADWVAELAGELDGELVELLDTGLDPVRVVAAAPAELAAAGLAGRRVVVASEYRRLTEAWIAARELDAVVVRSWGATEVYPPEDADVVVDNTATGATLAAHGLVVVDELLRSSTRLFASARALREPAKRAGIEGLVLSLGAVLEARRRVMLEVNVPAAALEAVVAVLPCMREPTISSLHGDAGFAVKAAVLREELPRIVPAVKARGGTDLVVSPISQVVP